MAEDRAALLDEADRRGLLPPDMKSAYEEAKKRDLIKPEGMLSRIGHGLMDPIYGAAQLGSRLTEPGEEMLADPAELEAQRKGRQETIDKTIKEREAAIQAQRPSDQRGSTDWLRVGGSIPSTMALAPGGPGIAGAAVGGAMAGAIQPTTDTEHFGAEKAEGAILGGTAGGVLGAGAKAAGAGIRALGAYLAREYPENVMTAAVQKVLKRMGQDEKAGGPTAQQAIDLINEANAAGKPMTLADVGGENVRALAGNVARQPGESRNVATQFLNQRDEGAGQRLDADIKQFVHGGDSMFKSTRALVEARSKAADPAYEIAMDPAKIVDSPRLREFLADPTVRQGIPAGLESQRLEALAAGKPFNPNAAEYFAMDEAGNITGVKGVPNMRTLDAVKRGMDKLIDGETDSITGRMSQRGTMLNRVRAEFVRELDALNPDYAAARAAWGGPSAAMTAMKSGRRAFNSTPEEIAAEFGDMTKGDQEFFRIGVADSLRERLMKTGFSGDDAKAIIKNPWMREQLRPIFRSDADFNGFVDAVTREGKMFGTKFETLGGPQTAKRIAEDTSHENKMAAEGFHLAEQAGTGKWLSAIKTATRMWRDRQDRAGNPKLNEQVARILFQTPIDPAGEVGQRLTGQFTGSASVNHLAPAAEIPGYAAQVLAPGAGSALSHPSQ